MIADMHMHSRYSDGSDWPKQLVAQARQSKLQLACLTDHDTMAGVWEFLAASASAGISAFPAVEIDCYDKEIQYKSEILAYFPLGTWTHTEGLLTELLAGRRQRIGEFCRYFANLYALRDLSLDALLAVRLAGGESSRLDSAVSGFRLSKTDIFRYLQAAGVLRPDENYKQFKRYWYDQGPLTGQRIQKPNVRDLVTAVKRDGGHLVLPHIGHEFDDNPARLVQEKAGLRKMLRWFRAVGVGGIEMYPYRGDSSGKINALVRSVAEELGFFLTWGTDYHGIGSDKAEFGICSGYFAGFPAQAE